MGNFSWGLKDQEAEAERRKRNAILIKERIDQALAQEKTDGH